MTFDEVVARFPGARRLGDGKAEAPCSAHDDAHASLSIAIGTDARVLLHCHAGCTTPDVLAAVGLTERDLFADARPTVAPKPRIAAIYDYQNPDGSLHSQAVRYEPKDFRQRRPNGKGAWVWKKAPNPIPYGLPAILEASSHDWIFSVEGEKDCDNGKKAGLLCTTNAGGRGSSKVWKLPTFHAPFKGRRVAVIPDNDVAGEEHAAIVAQALAGIAAQVKVIRLPGLPVKGDLSNWLATGHIVDELRALVAAAPLYGAAPATPAEPLTTCLLGIKPEKVTWLWTGRLSVGKVTVLDGLPGSGKSTMTCDAAARVSRGLAFPGDHHARNAGGVIFVAGEDGVADTVVPRLLAADADLSKCFVWPANKLPYLPDGASDIAREIQRRQARLLVLDPVTALFARDLSTNSDQDVRLALTPLAVAAEELGCCVLMLRHLNKRSGASALDRGGGSVGIGALARVVLLVARDHADPDVRILATVKANLTRPPRSLKARILDLEGVGRISYGEECDITADSLVTEPQAERRGKTDGAADWLRQVLADGVWHRQKEIETRATSESIAPRTLRRAREDAGIKCKQMDGGWWWRLPPDAHSQDDGHLDTWTPGERGAPIGHVIINNNSVLGVPDSQAAKSTHTPLIGHLPPSDDHLTASAQGALPLPMPGGTGDAEDF